MMTVVSNDLRCFWCNRPGAGDENYGGIIKNGIIFCWLSGLDSLNLCGAIRNKMDTMVDNHECPVCMETKKAFELPSCTHKVCLDCYKIIYFGISEFEKPCEYSLDGYPEWTYENQFDEDDDLLHNEKDDEHNTSFLIEKMKFDEGNFISDGNYTIDQRTYSELIAERDGLMSERPEWMNKQEIINYENAYFKWCTQYRDKLNKYLSGLIKGNKMCPLCRTTEPIFCV